jgi:NAD(P)-dependent dehydrogenase (short-subunit alcohol dehydrogenase family)
VHGKTVIVTGANSGFGFHVARELAKLGAHVVMACRNEERGEDARQNIQDAVADARLELMMVDLSDQASIRQFVSTFREQHERLDVLINNAGIYVQGRRVTRDGVESIFATNVLAFHTLISLLTPCLSAARPSRVVNVASDFAGDLDLDDLQFEARRFHGRRAYRQSKACDRMLTREWARRLKPSGVTVNAVAPGMVMTGLYANTTAVLRAFMRVLHRFFGRSLEEGADTIIWLATDPSVAERTGAFFDQRRSKPCQFEDETAEGRLFEYCDSLLA